MTEGVRPEVERALRFIAENLERPLTVAEVARAAHMSEFHLHRVFHSQMGESIGRFVTRRRLELAALRLAYEGDRSITDISLSSGYSSSSNFSKAFTAYFGCSPSHVRDPNCSLPPGIGKLMALYGKDFRPAEMYSAPRQLSRDEQQREASRWGEQLRFEQTEGMSFACLASTEGYDFSSLERTWTELLARTQQLGLWQDQVDAWSMVHDSPQVTAPELCRYHACVPCLPDRPLPAPLFRSEMAAGRYAVFHYEGAVEGVAEAYRSIYSCWFRESSVAPHDFVPLDHYIAGFPENGRVELDMWFRVRPRR